MTKKKVTTPLSLFDKREQMSETCLIDEQSEQTKQTKKDELLKARQMILEVSTFSQTRF